jgi:hypothetical protein
MRSTGKPCEGHVEAESEEWAFHALANNGIITEALRKDPKVGAEPPETPLSKPVEPLLRPYNPTSYAPPPPPPAPSTLSSPTKAAAPPPGTFAVNAGTPAPAAPPQQPHPGAGDTGPEPKRQFDNALEGALDGASSQIDFDALTDRYRGKKVWVIDRDKIRRNVARVVDTAIAQSLVNDEGSTATRERVADAINELFKDTRNLTSQHSATNTSLEKQIGRLAGIIKQFEGSLASMQAAIRNIGSGGGGGVGPRRHRGDMGVQKQEQNAVLLEIFKTNLDLLRGMEEEMRAASGAALDEVITDTDAGPSGESAPSDEGATAEASVGEPEPAVAQAAQEPPEAAA